ncbi:hypothetical protein BS47DRAFT_1326655 [Hydnum rufescens UP504]|uniref:Tcp11-domain-containing protein n=1 Tax=Hydnum rufescens UP504 TaxID=1448309 RepID=A0A9P6B3Y6_9AGAM|nr:hypothetical protein BS47DRAFT_1326655 [Hydnum rufescens UP504]
MLPTNRKRPRGTDNAADNTSGGDICSDDNSDACDGGSSNDFGNGLVDSQSSRRRLSTSLASPTARKSITGMTGMSPLTSASAGLSQASPSNPSHSSVSSGRRRSPRPHKLDASAVRSRSSYPNHRVIHVPPYHTPPTSSPLPPCPRPMLTPIPTTFPTLPSPSPSLPSTAPPRVQLPAKSTFFPAAVPPIRRETLRELDLEAILGNVQLRHDLLFDSGLQFRPTTCRRKRQAADRYWLAIRRELESGCTCTTFDMDDRVLECVCHTPQHPQRGHSVRTRWPTADHSKGSSLTNNLLPSRIPALITELREVMLSVMSPSPIPPPVHYSNSPTLPESPSDAFVTKAMKTSRAIASKGQSSPSTPLSPTATDAPDSPSPPAPAVPDPFAFDTPLPPQAKRFPVIYPELSSQTLHQHTQLRAVLDVELIVQQIVHGVFDPVGLIRYIGHIIKFHCAPMRDILVSEMVELAQSSLPGSDPARPDLHRVVQAFRRCFDLLELMKLDIANHQLQNLRPYLNRTAVNCELDALHERLSVKLITLDGTRRWISKHYKNVTSASSAIGQDEWQLRASKTLSLDRAICEGIIDLVFDPPPCSSVVAATFAEQLFLPPPSPTSQPSPTHLHHHHQQPQQAPKTSAPGYPETLWLDQTRLSILSTDAADLTALYMMLLLYRQVAHLSSTYPRIQEWELERVKREIWELGPDRLGWHFFKGGIGAVSVGDEEEQHAAWERGVRDITLQLAVRAQETASGVNSSVATEPSNPPDASMLQLVEGWMHTHLQNGSGLHQLMKTKLRRALLDVVRMTLYTPLADVPFPPQNQSQSQTQRARATMPRLPPGNGLEPLMPEIQHLGERIAKLVAFHSRVYHLVYEASGFIMD